MIGILVGLALGNMTEWAVHKYVLHGMGKKKGSFWRFHWSDHHQTVRRNGHLDSDYRDLPFSWNAQGKEAAALLGGCLLVAPLFPVAPFLVGTLWYCAGNYWYKHRRSHLDPEWAREHLRWHWDHHMGKNQDANWAVTKPWSDFLMGTSTIDVDDADVLTRIFYLLKSSWSGLGV
jgi:hypothetical protein